MEESFLDALSELRTLRERELEVFSRIYELLGHLLAERSAARPAPFGEAPGSGAEARATEKPAETPPGPVASPPNAVEPAAGSPSEVPPWIDAMVEAALSHAFGKDPGDPLDCQDEDDGSPEDHEGDEDIEVWSHAPVLSLSEPGRAASAPAELGATAQPIAETPDAPEQFLLLGCGPAWVGLPWRAVAGIGLSEEEDRSEYRYSLLDLVHPGHEPSSEPFRVSWRQGQDGVSMTCERLGGALAVERAAERGVEAVLVPTSEGNRAPDLVSLVEYMASLRRAEADSAPVSDPIPAEARPSGERESVKQSSQWPAQPSALLAVRYLPARVAIARTLRAKGWLVLEALDPVEVAVRLRQVRFQALFADLSDIAIPELLFAIQRASDSGTRILAVGSRLRSTNTDPTHALGDVPRLLYPFQENELERALGSLRPA